jgi:hypothetical protein
MQPDDLRRTILANPPPRYGDWAGKANELTNGEAKYYDKVQELIRKHREITTMEYEHRRLVA